MWAQRIDCHMFLVRFIRLLADAGSSSPSLTLPLIFGRSTSLHLCVPGGMLACVASFAFGPELWARLVSSHYC